MIRSYNILPLSWQPQAALNVNAVTASVYTWLHTQEQSLTPDFSVPLLPDGSGIYTLYGVRHYVEERMRQTGAPWLHLWVDFTGSTDNDPVFYTALDSAVSYCDPLGDTSLLHADEYGRVSHEFYCDFSSGYAFMQNCFDTGIGPDINPVSVRADITNILTNGLVQHVYALSRNVNNAVDTFSKPLADILADADIDTDDQDLYEISLTMLTRAGGSGQIGIGPAVPLFTYTYHSARARQALNIWYKDALNRWQYLWLPCSVYTDISRKEETALLMEGNRLPYNITSEKTYHADTDLINLTQAKQIEGMMRSHDIRINLSDTPLPPTLAHPTGISDGTSAAMPGTLTTTPVIAQHRMLIREQECVSYRAGIKPAFKLSFNISPL